MAFSLWKQIRKKLRRGRRRTWQLAAIACFLAASAFQPPARAEAAQSEPDGARASLIETLRRSEAPLTVKLKRVFLCGEEMRALGAMEARSLIDLLRRHPEWTASLDKDGAVLLLEQVDELADKCKGEVYIGMDRDGYLSLFEGPPERNKVLRTFFQLDVRYMESSLPKDRLEALERGIQVSDTDEFNSILSSFSDFALTRTGQRQQSPY